ncbi:hypothetical protein [Rhizobium leguminosarum]|uniref:hypothetical protein n=1 Tax=Rhizobium leguminosarum TaxID=384 RepID=UPI00103722E6|nr:hypothetical protein [Rhizobium leguminosarum]TBF85702.1 hypothetical protein ELG85_37215 [Rhizobium leguminosarum]
MTSKRGRPQGDGQNDDRALKEIASKLVSGQTYDEAAAAVYLAHKPKGTHVTKTVKDRWRRKWKQRGEGFLTEARTPIVRFVFGPGPDRLMPTRDEILKGYFDQNPAEQLKTALEYSGLTMDQIQAHHAEMAEKLRDPMVRDALDRIRSGEVHSALALFRKYQS